jgi:hypothetical protein
MNRVPTLSDARRALVAGLQAVFVGDIATAKRQHEVISRVVTEGRCEAYALVILQSILMDEMYRAVYRDDLDREG